MGVEVELVLGVPDSQGLRAYLAASPARTLVCVIPEKTSQSCCQCYFACGYSLIGIVQRVLTTTGEAALDLK